MSHVHLFVGQCGNQLALPYWNRAQREVGGKCENSLFHTAHLHKARALFLDAEPKVLRPMVDASDTFRPNNVLYQQNGCGNNWALGYQSSNRYVRSAGYKRTEQIEITEAFMDSYRREVEKCESFLGTILTHSLAGGTGSGLGSRLLEIMRDDEPKSPILSTCVAPFQTGDTPLQHYNMLLSLAWVHKYCDAAILFQNEDVRKVIQSDWMGYTASASTTSTSRRAPSAAPPLTAPRRSTSTSSLTTGGVNAGTRVSSSREATTASKKPSPARPARSASVTSMSGATSGVSSRPGTRTTSTSLSGQRATSKLLKSSASSDPVLSCMNDYIANTIGNVLYPLQVDGNADAFDITSFVSQLCPFPRLKILEARSSSIKPLYTKERAKTLESVMKLTPKYDIFQRKILNFAATGYDRNVAIDIPELEKEFAKRQKSHPALSGLASGDNSFNPINIQYSLQHKLRDASIPSLTHSADRSFTLCTNSTNIVGPIHQVLNKAKLMYNAKAYVHQYERFGCTSETFDEAFDLLEDVIYEHNTLIE
eukprot:GFYU01020746.1.p1 GENE.GFYU01020746.1~~GFYU01020746.1.p1  ORF type:complete len:537 (+),score=59.87 GFYU01020746.1:253-1863(+)